MKYILLCLLLFTNYMEAYFSNILVFVPIIYF